MEWPMIRLFGLPILAWVPRSRYFMADPVPDAYQLPRRLPRKAIVLVEDDGRMKWAAFDCPCEKHHRLLLNLDRKRHPGWQLSTNQHVSFSPSIDFHSDEFRCHYFIQNGQVQWAKSS